MTDSPTQHDYIECTNAAIDFIVRHLDGELNLEALAEVAGFSPFHFHRVFKSLVGETLNQFVKRQRLERSLFMMSHSPELSLTEICLACGFSSSSDFSRSFKTRYGTAPSEFDVSKFRDSRRKEFEEAIAGHEQGYALKRLPPGANPDGFKAKIRDLPARTVAYIRALNPYQSNTVVDTSRQLVRWAEARGLANGQWLGYMWDDPEIVALADCRYDTAVVVDESQFKIQAAGEIGRFVFPAMTVAEVTIAGDIQLEQRAIDWLYGTWLPQSGYVPDDQPAFEAWSGQPFEHGDEHFELSCQLPIQRLAGPGRKPSKLRGTQ